MAIYRNVSMSFWTDKKIVDDFTPEDKYFYLYLFTNPHTNLCGCYEISLKQISNETGYSKDSIESLLTRFENTHHVIKRSKQSGEILILHWCKYNWTTSDKFRKPLEKEISNVKDAEFKRFLMDIFRNGDTVSIPYPYGMDTTVTVTVSDNNSNKDIDTIKEIINYFNNKCNVKYKYTTKSTQEKINARLREGFTLEDFKRVIDYKYEQWHNDERMKEFLRPETLFCTKFESYLNNAPKKKKIVKPKEEEPIIDLWSE